MDLTGLHRFHLAPGGDPANAASWVWQDRSADVNSANGITITGGRGDEVGEIDAGVVSLELDNAGGHYCTGNPLGRWYGQLSRGCPARWGTISGAATFTTNAASDWGLPTVGTSWSLEGTGWSASGGTGRLTLPTPNLANAAVLNGADARNGDATFVCLSSIIATGGPLIYGLQVRRTDSSSYLMFNVELSTSGSISAKIRRLQGAFSTLATNEPLAFTYSVNQRIKARCQWDGPALRLKVWPEASAEPDAWTVTATDSTVTGSGVAFYLWRFGANTNPGAVTMFVDDLEVEAVEAVGTVPEWPTRWDPTATVSYAPIQIAGITRRLAQGQAAVRSPIYLQLIGQNPQAYWPLEDGPNAIAATSAVSRGARANTVDVTFGSSDCPAGASSAAMLNTIGTSRISGQVKSWSVPQDGYAGMIYFRLPSLPPSITSLKLLEFTGVGTITRWVLYVNNAVFTLEGYDASGTLTVAPIALVFVVDPTRWMAIQLETQESGANVNWSLIWYQLGDTTFFTMNGSYVGTADRLTSGTVYAPVAGALVSHFWLGDDLLPFVDPTFILVSTGYAGEAAAARIARLARDAGVPVAIEPGTTEAMGPQRSGGFLELSRAAEAADMGLLYEAGASLGYRPRRARYNRAAAVALSITGLDVADPAPGATDDDLRIRNAWTVARDGGGEATVEDTAHIAKNGRYPDSVTINVKTDDVLDDHASWRVHLGTWGEMRWPQITLDLTDRPSLLTFWRGRVHGPRITISGVPDEGPIGVDLDLVVEGWTQTVTSHSWQVTLNCSPAKMWDTGIYDNAGSRYDSGSTTLVGAQTTSSTSWAITTTDRLDVWSTTAVPYTWKVAGEDVTVTFMTAAAGTGPYTQTATVTRSVNGIVKAHAAGEAIHLATPVRYGL